MKLFGSTKKLIDETKYGEKIPSLEVVKVVLVQCNLVDNRYQQKSEVLYTFTPSKSYGYLLNVEPSNLMFLKTYNTEFDEIIIIFTDQNGRPLEIEDKANLTLLINKQNQEQENMLKDMDLYHSQENIKNNNWIQDQMLPKKQSIKQVNLQEIKTADTVTKSSNDNIEKQEPVAEIIIPPEKRDEILNKLRKVL